MFFLHDEPDCIRFALVAQLEPEELRDLEACWRTAESTRAQRELVIDIRKLVSIDEPTRALLGWFRTQGARLLEPSDPGGHHKPGLLTLLYR